MKITPTMGGAYSGSLGGLTASHNKGGQYLRRRSVPTNPNTARQQAVRSILGGLTNAWSDDLSDAQTQAWRDYAANTPVTDSLGQTMQLSGLNMFVRGNSARLQLLMAAGAPLARVDTAPVVFNTGEPVASVTTFTGDFTTPPGTVTISGDLGGAAPVGGLVHIFIAAPQTPGTRFYKGPYQLATSAAISATDTDYTAAAVDLSSAWFASTTPVVGWDGLYVPLRMVVVYSDGRVSMTWREMVQFTDATP